jgi:hypothetical protein
MRVRTRKGMDCIVRSPDLQPDFGAMDAGLAMHMAELGFDPVTYPCFATNTAACTRESRWSLRRMCCT